MQRERQGRNDFFAMGDPFGKFRGFGKREKELDVAEFISALDNSW